MGSPWPFGQSTVREAPCFPQCFRTLAAIGPDPFDYRQGMTEPAIDRLNAIPKRIGTASH
jgi:hypothetical protein